MQSHLKGRSGTPGFNLVEAAIVLGIVGLVIGGIWWAAGKVSEQNQANQVISDMHYIIDRVQQFSQSRPLGSFTNTDISGAIQLFFPPGYVAGANGGYAYRPDSKIAWRLNTNGTNNQMLLSFGYDLDLSATVPNARHSMPKGLCMRVLMEYMAALSDAARPGTTGTLGFTTDNGATLLSIAPDTTLYKDWQSSGGQSVQTTCSKGLKQEVPTSIYLR